MLFYRAGIPAWMEILKRNLDEKNAEGSFPGVPRWDMAKACCCLWRWGRCWTTRSGNVEILVCRGGVVWIDRNGDAIECSCQGRGARTSRQLERKILRPWTDAIQLMRDRKDFAVFNGDL